MVSIYLLTTVSLYVGFTSLSLKWRGNTCAQAQAAIKTDAIIVRTVRLIAVKKIRLGKVKPNYPSPQYLDAQIPLASNKSLPAKQKNPRDYKHGGKTPRTLKNHIGYGKNYVRCKKNYI